MGNRKFSLRILSDRIWSSPSHKHVLGLECHLTMSAVPSLLLWLLLSLELATWEVALQALALEHGALHSSGVFAIFGHSFSLRLVLRLITFSLPEKSFPHSCNWTWCTKALVTCLLLHWFSHKNAHSGGAYLTKGSLLWHLQCLTIKHGFNIPMHTGNGTHQATVARAKRQAT